MTNNEQELPTPERFMEVVLGKAQWTSSERELRKSDPGFLMEEGKTHAKLAMSPTDQKSQGESHLSLAYQATAEMPTRELQIAAMDIIYTMLSKSCSLQSQFAAMCPEHVELSDESFERRMIASQLQAALSEYVSGPSFWEGIYVGKDVYATLARRFEESYPGVPLEIADRIDAAILARIHNRTSVQADADTFQQIQTEIDRLGSTPNSKQRNVYRYLSKHLSGLQETLNSDGGLQKVRGIVRDLRQAEFPHFPSKNWDSPLGRG